MSKLTPTVVSDKDVGDVLFDGVRRRPVVAINDNGETVVCCRRTAVNKGWKIQSSPYLRERPAPRKGKPAAEEDFEPVAPRKAKANKPKRGRVEDVSDLL